MSNYYEILGVHQNATSEEIKRAYRKEAMRWHPDREGGDKATFQLLQEAYRWLGDIIKRAEYDKTLKQQKPETKQQQKPPPKKKNQTPVPEKAKKSNISDGKWTPPNPPRYNAWQDCAKPKEPFFTNLRVLIVGVCLAGAGACIVGSFVLLNNSSTTEQATENVKQDVSTEVVVEEKSHLLFTGYNIYGISDEDIKSGKVVKNHIGTYWFKEAGNNMQYLHNNNGPAIIYIGGTKEWYKDGKLHRVGGPAILRADGTQEWWLNGIKYTEEEFNSIDEDIKSGKVANSKYGTYWFKEPGNNMLKDGRPGGILHREYGPAVIWPDGTEVWKYNGRLHRVGGPAVVFSDGSNKEWWVNGELHRVDGPAIERRGKKYFFLDGEEYTEEEFSLITKNKHNNENIASSVIVNNQFGTFYFRSAGVNTTPDGLPVMKNLHREDGPAIIHPDGAQYWYINGHLRQHLVYGVARWFKNGKLHRSGDLPAVIHPDGTREFWVNGMRHRDYGPAIEYPHAGLGLNKYYAFGQQIAPDK